MEEKRKRDSNIELLRVVAILMVVFLHLYNHAGGLELAKGVPGGIVVSNLIYTVAIAAVDIFLIISGFFSVRVKSFTLAKPLRLVLMSSGYSLFFYILTNFGEHSFKGVLFALIPKSYFVNIFCVVYLLSPWINTLLTGLDCRRLSKLIVLLSIIFCLWPTVVNAGIGIWGKQMNGVYPVGFSGTDRGFTFVNFTYCYTYSVPI